MYKVYNIKFINHASVVISNEDCSLMSDPWYSDQVFHKGWRLLHENSPEDILIQLTQIQYIWISHEHPDHFSVGFFMKYLKEEGYEIDDSISEEVIGFGEVLPKGEYVLANDILNKEEEELTAKKGDKVIAYDDEAPIDTILGIDIFPIVHVKTQEKIYVSLEDIK